MTHACKINGFSLKIKQHRWRHYLNPYFTLLKSSRLKSVMRSSKGQLSVGTQNSGENTMPIPLDSCNSSPGRKRFKTGKQKVLRILLDPTNSLFPSSVWELNQLILLEDTSYNKINVML